MSPREGMYYVGLMGGLILASVAARFLNVPWLVAIIVGFVIGIGMGTYLERWYGRVQEASRQNKNKNKNKTAGDGSTKAPVDAQLAEPRDSPTAECPKCGWKGDARFNTSCPRCGKHLA